MRTHEVMFAGDVARREVEARRPMVLAVAGGMAGVRKSSDDDGRRRQWTFFVHGLWQTPGVRR